MANYRFTSLAGREIKARPGKYIVVGSHDGASVRFGPELGTVEEAAHVRDDVSIHYNVNIIDDQGRMVEKIDSFRAPDCLQGCVVR